MTGVQTCALPISPKEASFVPRPVWQVWAARAALVLMILFVIYQILTIANGGR